MMTNIIVRLLALAYAWATLIIVVAAVGAIEHFWTWRWPLSPVSVILSLLALTLALEQIIKQLEKIQWRYRA